MTDPVIWIVEHPPEEALAIARGILFNAPGVAVHLSTHRRPPPTALVHEVPGVVVVRAWAGDPGFLEWLRALTDTPSAPRTVVVTDKIDDEQRDALACAGADAVIPRAAQPSIVAVAACGLRDPGLETLAGELPGLASVDMLQLFCAAGRTGIMRVLGDGTQAGLWLEGGDVVHAVHGRLSGMAALVEWVRTEHGRFRWRGKVAAHRRSIGLPWKQAILTAACTADEIAAGHSHSETSEAPRVSGPPVVAAVTDSGPRDELQDLVELGSAALRRGDLAAAREYWARAKQLQLEATAKPSAPEAHLPRVSA